jgi:hypothetical protein
MIYTESVVNQCKIKSSIELPVYFLTKIFPKKGGVTHKLLCVFIKNYSTSDYWFFWIKLFLPGICLQSFGVLPDGATGLECLV